MYIYKQVEWFSSENISEIPAQWRYRCMNAVLKLLLAN